MTRQQDDHRTVPIETLVDGHLTSSVKVIQSSATGDRILINAFDIIRGMPGVSSLVPVQLSAMLGLARVGCSQSGALRRAVVIEVRIPPLDNQMHIHICQP